MANVVSMGRRLATLEARYSPDALLAAMSDEELEHAFAAACDGLARAGVEPPSGWDGPLPSLIRWLERETAH